MGRRAVQGEPGGASAGSGSGATAAPAEEHGSLAILAAHRTETDGLERLAVAPAVGTSVNEVRLVGRLGATSQERTLPSGDAVLTFHVVVDRASTGRAGARPRPGRSGGNTSDGVDALACAAWSARARRTVRSLEPGTWIEVDGALRRRFRRGAVPPVSFYEVEVARVRRVR
jgi:single-strand DNA-binding protein